MERKTKEIEKVGIKATNNFETNENAVGVLGILIRLPLCTFCYLNCRVVLFSLVLITPALLQGDFYFKFPVSSL